MEPLKEAIEEFLKAHKLDKRLDQYEVFRIWDELVGERIAKVARPDFIKHETLWIKVSNPVWKTELNFMKQDLMKKIGSATKNQIKQIKIM
jgi:predicted nucleic acid-binding Zn ribbon protein